MTRQFSLAVLVCMVIASFFVTEYLQPPLSQAAYVTESIKIKDIQRKGRLIQIQGGGYLVKTFHLSEEIRPGDTINFRAKKIDVRDSTQKYYSESYSKYLLSQKIYYQTDPAEIKLIQRGRDLYTLRYHIREKLSAAIDSLYPKESAMIKAITYGDKSQMSKEQNQLFSITGTSHVLALSGFHVGILGVLINIALEQVSVKKRGLITLFILAIYAFLTGLRASILRATSFFVLYYLAFLKNKRYNLFASAALMASLLLMTNPYYIYDMGFVLSFAGVFSIACFYPLLKHLIAPYSLSQSKIVKMSLVTLAAQGFTLPLVAYYFGTVSLVSIPANLVIVPLISILMPLSIISLGLHMASFYIPLLYPMDMGLASVVKLIQRLVIKSAEVFAAVPYSHINLKLSQGKLMLLMTLLVGLYLIWEVKIIRENKYEPERGTKLIT